MKIVEMKDWSGERLDEWPGMYEAVMEYRAKAEARCRMTDTARFDKHIDYDDLQLTTRTVVKRRLRAPGDGV